LTDIVLVPLTACISALKLAVRWAIVAPLVHAVSVADGGDPLDVTGLAAVAADEAVARTATAANAAGSARVAAMTRRILLIPLCEHRGTLDVATRRSKPTQVNW
jgi:hypothetical protein